MSKIHPGKILREEYLLPMHISVTDFANKVGIPWDLAYSLITEKVPLTLEVAQKLSKSIGGSAQYWINLQDQFNS